MGPLAKGLQPSRFDLRPTALGEWRLALVRTDLQTRIQVALMFSFMLHLFLIVGVTMRPPDHKLDVSQSPLIVDLVNARSPSAPQKPDILAQANLDGGGNSDAARRAKSPLPVTKQESATEIAVQTRRSDVREPESRQLITQTRDQAPSVTPPEPKPQAEAQPENMPTGIDIINYARKEIQLRAQINRDLEDYQKRPRRTFIGARAKEFRFARYIEDWRIKVERVGEQNYPATARGTYGALQVSVAIRADGSLEGVEINRSSGKKVLDEAAIRIVRLAAPFAAFPPDIASDTDILSITRTWSFTRSDQFQAE